MTHWLFVDVFVNNGLLCIYEYGSYLHCYSSVVIDDIRLDRRPWLLFAVGIQVFGFAGLMLLPASMLILWVAMIGWRLSACFSLTLTVALNHLSSPKLAGAFTAFVQGAGFIITAIIPYFAGFLREWSGSFQAVWLMLLITLVSMLIVTIKFAPESY